MAKLVEALGLSREKQRTMLTLVNTSDRCYHLGLLDFRVEKHRFNLCRRELYQLVNLNQVIQWIVSL